MSTHQWPVAFGFFLSVSGSSVFTSTWASDLPDYYEEPGYSSERDASTDQAANEVIDPFGGGLQLQYNDMVIPGNGGLDIVIRRTYRSLQSQPGVLGASYLTRRTSTGIGWDIHFGRVWSGALSSSSVSGCKLNNTDVSANPVLELADGTRQVLANSRTSSYAFITKDRWIAKCRSDGLDVYSPNGRRYVFNKFHQVGSPTYYSVTRIEDANGNYQNFNYSSGTNNNGEYILESITSSANSTVSFSYDNKFGSNTLLRKISVNGRTLTYNYKQAVDNGLTIAGYFYMTSAVRSGSPSYSYSYYESRPASNIAGLYSLKTATMPGGRKANFTYKLVRFDPAITSFLTTSVSKKSISGGGVTGGTWSYAYSPGSTTDKTTVTTPLGRIVYYHRSSQSASQGSVWRIGTLTEKRKYTGSALTQTEKYTWDRQIISTQDQLDRRNIFVSDAYVYAPILTKKTVTRDGTLYQTTYSGHDSYGNPATKSESGNGSSRTTSLTYYINTGKWIMNQLDRETISGIGTVNRGFSSNGNVTFVDRYGVVTNYTYSGSGDIRTRTDPRGTVTRYENYRRGVPRNETRAEGTADQVIIIRVVNSTGTIASETVDGRTTSFTYDSLDRVKSITRPKSSSNVVNISWSYLGSGITRVMTRGTFSETKKYDSLGRIKSSNVEGILTTFNNDAEGNQTFRSDPGSSGGDTRTYDILGRLKRTTHRDNSYTENTYQSSNRTRVRDERGKLTTYSYRSYGNPDEQLLTRIAAPESVTTDIARNAIGKITSVSQGGKTRAYVYDTRQFLDYIVNPETGTTQYDFDDNENLISSQVGSSGLTTYVYDALDRMISTNYPGITPDIGYSYYPTGELNTIQKGSSLWTYLYDNNRNLTSETLAIGSTSYAIGRGYNSNDVLQSVTYPSGLSIAYNPDDLGRPTTVGNYVSQVQYFPDSQIRSLQFANGVATVFTQDNRRRPENLDVTGSAGAIIDRLYGYDAASNTTSINDFRNPSNDLLLGYDDVDRLESVNGSVAISYDATGNIATKNTGTNNLAYSYNATTGLLDGVTRGGAAWYTLQYDVYGNVTGNGFDTFSYDDASQLTQVSNQGISYEYDGNGNRFKTIDGTTKHIVYARNGLLMYEDILGNIESSDYIYLGRQLIARRDQCGSIDTDTDGIPDCVETRGGLDPSNSADASLDGDADGLTNLREYQAGTNFNNPDTDADGMSDGFEVDNGLNPLLAIDAGLDADTDGLTNLQEFQFGTNPNLADTDGDGVDDVVEIAAGTDPTSITNFPGDGDINNNGETNVGDLVLLYQMVMGARTPTAAQITHADMNQDGQLNVADILLLQRQLLQSWLWNGNTVANVNPQGWRAAQGEALC